MSTFLSLLPIHSFFANTAVFNTLSPDLCTQGKNSVKECKVVNHLRVAILSKWA